MKRILLSILVIGGAAALAFGASRAFFSDTETSEGNTFQAGSIDLKVDYEGYYNKAVDNTPNAGFWELKDLTKSEVFFNFNDIKPGDYGEGTISLHVYNNDAYACTTINPTLNDDVTSTEPELSAGDSANTDSIFDGELAQNMIFRIWADVCTNQVEPGDNIYQPNCDKLLTEGTGPIKPVTWALAAPGQPNVFTGNTGEALTGLQTYFIGVDWSLPNTVGNIVQTDKYMADISFYVEQSRNNPNFKCPTVSPNGNVLRLENEREVVGGPWEVIVDNMFVDMTYNTSGSTFDYTLVGQGLPANTSYDLFYYADGWPGNNPGAFIGTHTTSGTGTLNVALTSKELNMNLPTAPDGNLLVGAKIWLIPSSAYDETTNSVVVWPPDFSTWLFEGNVYIHYDDTDVP